MKNCFEHRKVCPPRILIINDQLVKSDEGSSTPHSSTAMDKDRSSVVRIEFLHLVDQVKQYLNIVALITLYISYCYLCIIWSCHVRPAVALQLLYHSC